MSSKPSAVGLKADARHFLRRATNFRQLEAPSLDSTSDPYIHILDIYSSEVQQNCRELLATDKKKLEREAGKWDRQLYEDELKLRFCYDLNKVRASLSFSQVLHLTIKQAIAVDDDAHRVDDFTRKRNICIAVTVVLLVCVTTLFVFYSHASP